jgi:hypothetical protein
LKLYDERMSETSPCPICGTAVTKWERYPNLLCSSCVALARDEQGRPMRFSNDSDLGFAAEAEEDGSWRPVEDATYEATCWVEGRRCVAGEHRFGGIAVQVVE